MGTNNLTTQTNNCLCEQKIKNNEQIIMYNKQNITRREHLIV